MFWIVYLLSLKSNIVLSYKETMVNFDDFIMIDVTEDNTSETRINIEIIENVEDIKEVETTENTNTKNNNIIITIEDDEHIGNGDNDNNNDVFIETQPKIMDREIKNKDKKKYRKKNEKCLDGLLRLVSYLCNLKNPNLFRK